MQLVNVTGGLGVKTVAFSAKTGVVWAGTSAKIYRFDGTSRWNFFWYCCAYPFSVSDLRNVFQTAENANLVLGGIYVWSFNRIPAVVDDVPTSMTLDKEGVLWVSNAICVNKLYPNITMTRVRGESGLPTANLTASTVSQKSGSVWIGSKQGLIR